MKKGFLYLWIFLVIVFLYLPILIMAVYSFTDSVMIGSIRKFSLIHYRTLFTTRELTKMMLNTFCLSIAASILSTLLGTAGAIGTFFRKKKAGVFVDLINHIPVVNADVVMGFSICVLLVVFFKMDKATFIPLLIGHMTLCTPFVYLSVMPKLRQLDKNLFEAALDLGSTRMQALFQILLREIFPGIISGFMLSLTLSLDDYFITTYTKPATFDTISTYVVNATRGARTPIKTALWSLSTIVFLLVVIVVVFMNLFQNRKKAEKKSRGSFLSPFAVLLLAAVASFCVSGCGRVSTSGKADFSDKEIVLRVANFEEYLDEGNWEEDETIALEDGTEIIGKNAMADDFEAWYQKTYGRKVRVEYSTFGYNEELYNQLSMGNKFDVVCASEYMILKLLREGKLVPFSDAFFDTAKEENYYSRGLSPFIIQSYGDLSREKEFLKYAAGYMWGTMGIVYNPEKVAAEDARHWDLFINEKYYKQVTMKDQGLDSYMVGTAILNKDRMLTKQFLLDKNYKQNLYQILNDRSPDMVDQVEEILTKMRINAYSLENDSGKADLVTGKVAANMQWSGDATYSMDQGDEDGVELLYSVPEEVTETYFDGWSILKEGIDGDQEKRKAAEAWVNFLSREDNVIRNMYYTGYTSVIAGTDQKILQYFDYMYGAETEDTVDYPLGYFFGKEDLTVKIDRSQRYRQPYAAYPPKEVLNRSTVLGEISEEEVKRINDMWIHIRCFDLKELLP